jgi:phage/plasmid primase-like uncharacterized protein
VEGYATGASVYEAMRDSQYPGTVVCAMDSGNLKPVALALMSKIRREHLGTDISFVADDDVLKETNVCYSKAKEASAAIGGVPVRLPEFEHYYTGSDFDDPHIQEVLAEVTRQISRAIEEYNSINGKEAEHNCTRLNGASLTNIIDSQFINRRLTCMILNT